MIQRDIIHKINPWIWENKIIILKWPRQVGKTTLLKEIKDNLDRTGNKTLYFSTDLELGNSIFLQSKNFINFIKTQLPEEGKLFIFLDEFQYIKNAWIFLKGVFDELKEHIQLIVSGSSSLEITKNTEFLTGRKVEFQISGISFLEYINYTSKYTYKKYDLWEIFTVWFDVDDIKIHLLDYLNWWSYPEVCTVDDISKKEIILKEIIATYISKDISWFMKIDNITWFNNLIRILANQIGNLVNKSDFSNTLDLDTRKLNYFIEILEWTYIIDLIRPYFTNIRKEISKMPKVYFNNPWVINYFQGKKLESIDTLDGAFVENFVYLLLKDDFNKNDIYYYRTISKSEIDFLIKIWDSFLPIEVKYRNKIWDIPVAIKNFEENYKNVSNKILITKNDVSFEKNNYKIPFYLLPFVSFNSSLNN